MEDKPYLGTGWAFPPHFIKGDNAGAALVSGEEDIMQSLRILISTVPGERIFRFDYGCDVRSMVFNKMNLSEKTMVLDNLAKTITDGEPRILLEHLDIVIKDANEGRLDLYITYIIKATNSRSNMVYPFYIHEGTNLENIAARGLK